jgi:hypothetical protein
MQPTEEGDDDRGEAIARRYRRRDLADRSGDLDHAGQTGERARQQQRQPDQPILAVAGIAGRRGRQSDHLDLESEQRARQQHPARGDHGQRQRGAEMQARALQDHRQQALRIEHAGLREIEALGIAPGAMDQHAEQQQGDIGQHQAGQDLAGVKARAQKRRDRRPDHAAERAGQQHQRQQPGAALAVEGKRHAAAGDGAQGKLALGADVPDIGAEADGKADGAQNQRRGLDRQFRQPVLGRDRLHEKGMKRRQRIESQQGEQDDAGCHRRQDGDNRCQPDHGQGWCPTGLQADQGGSPSVGPRPAASSNRPPISRPSCSTEVSPTGCGADNRP